MKEQKKAILVISFGTSHKNTREKTIGAIEHKIQKTFPDFEIRRAFTSRQIIQKLKTRDHMQIDTVSEALNRLAAEGFTTVICQPTHIIHGQEYEETKETIQSFQSEFESLSFGAPLLSSDEDYKKAVLAIQSEIPFLQPDDMLILAGHGTEHFANASYAALDYYFKSMGYANIFVGTVEAFPDLAHLKKVIQNHRPKTIHLMPFMIVAGDHAVNDLFGEEKEAWKPQLESLGYSVNPIQKGLGEYREIQAIFLSHIFDCISRLSPSKN